MGRSKHQESGEAPEPEAAPERSYHELVENVNAISRPLASRKLTRKLYKCAKKAAKHKQIRQGVKEVQRFINKGEKGLLSCGFSSQDLGLAVGTKRPTCVIMIKPHEEYQEAYDECLEEVEALPLPL
ncbi:PREDICTED: H/ACA ribonucleoprotein complex subunit 2 [Gekko japonicus]|uniref:H/ACA ribonucleoprotein complex subunit 2 n=1 Tax=Gekko japonicus TaxID=146911 RepID=A0ABM1K2P6_GEKJA|nr:PREDICTED: H/ACA ribonucleoprotein complex subunit 2 [Gekko japonicus]